METVEKKWVLPSRRKRHPATMKQTARRREGGGKEEEERERELEDLGGGDTDQHSLSLLRAMVFVSVFWF